MFAFPVTGHEYLMFLQFDVWVDVGPEEVITEGEKPRKARPHVLKTTASLTVSGPVMFLQAGDGVMSPSELTVGWNLHVSRPCDADGYLTLSTIVLFRCDPAADRLQCL